MFAKQALCATGPGALDLDSPFWPDLAATDAAIIIEPGTAAGN
jgi:hypothetical protein